MKIVVEKPTRIVIARYGPNRLFSDYKDRQALAQTPDGPAQLERLFLEAWNGGLEAAVKGAEQQTADWARERLSASSLQYFDAGQEHWHFRHENMEFIAQLRERSGGLRELTQLWRIPSGDDHPRVIWVTFDTVEEKAAFVAIAQNRLGYKAEDLALELIRDFMRKFQPHQKPTPTTDGDDIPF